MFMGAKSLWTFLLLGIYSGCGDLKMEEEATEILSENKNEEHVGIIESADGLQFTQNKPTLRLKQPLVFQNKAMYPTKEILRMISPTVYGRPFFRMVNPDGREIKRRTQSWQVHHVV